MYCLGYCYLWNIFPVFLNISNVRILFSRFVLKFEESFCMYNVILPWDFMADSVMKATGMVEFEHSLWIWN